MFATTLLTAQSMYIIATRDEIAVVCGNGITEETASSWDTVRDLQGQFQVAL
jgi:hypothetical protein